MLVKTLRALILNITKEHIKSLSQQSQLCQCFSNSNNRNDYHLL